MGNCLPSRVCAETGENLIKVMRMDGKMMEFTPPLMVRDVLTAGYHDDHLLVQFDNVRHALPLDHKLEGDQVYYLIPSHNNRIEELQSQSKHSNEDIDDGRKERLENSGSRAAVKVDKEKEKEKGNNGIRVKMVLSKQELQMLLSDGPGKENLVKELLAKQQIQVQPQPKDQVASRRWRPSLEKIPEVN